MNTSHDYFSQLLQTIQTLEPDAVLQHLQHAANQHAEDARPLLLIAAEYAHTGRMDEAEGTYIAALQRAPDFAIARFQLGLLQFSSGRPAAAFATWDPLIALDPHDPLRLFKTALEYLAADKFEDARHWFQLGISHNHDNPALNQDMQRFIEEIDKLQDNRSEKMQGMTEEAASAQFLVSAYHHLH